MQDNNKLLCSRKGCNTTLGVFDPQGALVIDDGDQRAILSRGSLNIV
jgi:hypothetical protein